MKIEFDLLANATDSITQAIELLAWKEEPNEARRLKQAVRAVAHGIELLLKERLRRVHPVLIWENVDKFPSLSARTVTVDVALNRLSRIGGLQFHQDDSALVTSLRDTRNAIEHYAWTTTKAEADRIVGQALGFALHFARDELSYDFFGYGSHRDDTFEVLLESNPHFAEAFRGRYERAANAKGEVNYLCDYCHALAVNPTTGACRLCGHWNSDTENDIPF
ncbi:MAG: hypothetical protein IPM03_12585 [Sulfuritalea sp.]|nr:hypothetical protein [Sulfuritalea sp.]